MNIDELVNSNKAFVTAAEIAPILESDPNTIRFAAQNHPEKLGFPVVIMKSRVKIPRIKFLNFLGISAQKKVS